MFLAIKPPCDLALTLHHMAVTLCADGLRWVAPERLHITLRYLGNCPDRQLRQIVSSLEHDLTAFPTFVARTGRLCLLPDTCRPRVLALEVEGGLTLKRLVGICEHAVVQSGFCAEARRFRGHVSLGRFRRKCRQIPDTSVELPGFSFAVQQIELLESVNVQTEEGQTVRYRTLHIINFMR